MVNAQKIALVALLAIALYGCGGSGKEQTAESQAQAMKPAVQKTDKPAYGDMIVRGSIADASVLLPILANDGASFGIIGLVYNGLVKYDKDIKLTGDLAKRWEISDDKRTIRFFLHKNVKWQDGQPFTAEDVKFTFDAYRDPKVPTSYATDFMKAHSLQVLDPYTVEVTYKEPYAPALGSWTQGMLPSHLLKGKDITKSPLKRHPIGTGPYKFREWKTQEKIVLDSYHHYFEHRPYIDRVMTRVIPDPATMFLELKASRIDQMGLSPLQYSRQTSSKWFDKNFHKYKYLTFAYTYLGYNLNDWRFKDRKVRQALTTAINRESIVQGVLLGLGQVAYTPYKPDTYWYNPNVKKFPYDPEKAKKMLAEAGWVDTNGDGILEKDGKPFEFTILTNQGNQLRERAATIIQADLRKVGIRVKIRTLEWAAFLNNYINKHNFEACLLGWGIGIDPSQIDIWNSKKTAEHELNFISYKNPEVDKLLDDAAATYDRKKRKKLYDKFQEIIAEDQPYTFLYVAYALPIISSRFYGVKPAPVGIEYNFIDWYVPKPLQKYHIQP